MLKIWNDWQKKKTYCAKPFISQFSVWFSLLRFLAFRCSYLQVCVAALFVREKTCASKCHHISMTRLHWLSDLFPLRDWHLITIATFQLFQLSLNWLTPLNICQHVHFLLDDIRALVSNDPGNSIMVECGKQYYWQPTIKHAGQQMRSCVPVPYV